MSIYDTEQPILLSQKDLPEPVLSRLFAHNIQDVVRFLNLADFEFAVLRRLLGISSDDLHRYVKNVRSNHPEVTEKDSHLPTDDWKLPPSGVKLDDLDSYDQHVRRSVRIYNYPSANPDRD